MKPGFLQCLKDNQKKCPNLNELNLVYIEDSSAIGAVLLAAKIHDKNNEFLKNFDYKKYSSQLDHIYLKSLQKNQHSLKDTNQSIFQTYLKGILW